MSWAEEVIQKLAEIVNLGIEYAKGDESVYKDYEKAVEGLLRFIDKTIKEQKDGSQGI